MSDLITPLGQAAADLTMLYARLADHANDIDKELESLFADALIEKGQIVSAAVDRRVFVLERLSSDLAAAKAKVDSWKFTAQRIETARERLAVRTAQILKDNPQVDFVSGTASLKLRKNGGVLPLIIKAPLDRRNYSRVIDDKDITQEMTPYLVRFSGWQLDGDKIREDLDAGKKLEFAEFGERGEGLKVDS